jgi:hypothetical protein
MAEITKQEYAEPSVAIPKPIYTPGLIPVTGGDAALIRFDSAYIGEQAKVSEDAQVLIEEAIDLLRKAGNHRRWQCEERSRIDDDLNNIEQQMKRSAGELSLMSSMLKKGAERFAELEERTASQESEINAELRKTWAFETDVWNPEASNGKKPGDDNGDGNGNGNGDNNGNGNGDDNGDGNPGEPDPDPIPVPEQPVPIQPVPPPFVIQPIIIYIPYPVPSSTTSPVTFSYPDSSGSGYGSSSFGGSGFFSGSGIEGDDSANSLLNMLLAWLTQILSGGSNASAS